MKQIFADTSYWIGLVNPRDQLHTKAVSVTQQLFSVRILTSEMVLTEVLNSFSDGGPLRRAVGSMVERLRGNRDVIIVPRHRNNLRARCGGTSKRRIRVGA